MDYPQKTRHNLFVIRIFSGFIFGESLEVAEQTSVYWEYVSRYKKFTLAVTNIHWESVAKTSFLFHENCQELPGIGKNLLRISSIPRS